MSHIVKLEVLLELDEMDGTPYESAAIALDLLDGAAREVFPPGEIRRVSVSDYHNLEE